MIPLNDYVLVQIEKKEKTSSGLIVAKDNQVQERGKVIHAGQSDLKKGDKVYFKSYSSIPIDVDGKDMHFVKYEEIIAKE